MSLLKTTLKLIKVCVRGLGYSKDESGYRATRFFQRASALMQKKSEPEYDLCMVIPDKSRGWILEAVCREIGTYFSGKWVISGAIDALPRAKAYYFCHYHFYLSAIKKNPFLWDTPCVVWLTHPKDDDLGGPSAQFALKNARIVTMCSMWRDYVLGLGFAPDKVTPIVGAADPEFFYPHERGSGKVGFCTAYYERKSPHRILELVKALPDVNFILMGRNWTQFAQFEEMKRLPNFEYREGSYQEYPAFYNELDVFVSLSDLEGGPIPLIESMMSNVVPVATRTGFAPDVIEDECNGYLCDVGAETKEVAALVRKALENQCNVRETVEHLTWRRFSELMQVELGLRDADDRLAAPSFDNRTARAA